MKISDHAGSVRTALLLGAGLMAIAIAAPQVSAQGAVFACVQPVSGTLYVVEEDGACKSPRHTALTLATAAVSGPTRATESLTLLNGWQEYGGDYAPPSATRVGDVVVLEGLIRGGTLPATVAQLPEGWEPAKKVVFPSYSRVFRTRVDVLEDGSIVVVDGTNQWITLSGVVFPVGGN